MVLVRNIIIVLVGLFVSLFVLGTVQDSLKEEMPEETEMTETPETQPEEPEESSSNSETQTFTSLKGVEIILNEPLPDQTITSPLSISGRAPGNWFFEADAPVVLTDWDGLIIAEGYVTVKGDWMTTDYVDFSGTLNFDKPAFGERGSFIFQKDNPSDMPELDDALELQIKF